MELLLLDQVTQGIYSAVFGFFCAFLYCLISAIRVVFSKRGSLLSYLFDFLYCAIVFVFLFLFVNSYFGGLPRGFMIAIIMCTFLICYLFVFRKIQAVFEKILLKVSRLILRCLAAVFSPVLRLFSYFNKKRAEISSIIKKNLKKRAIQRKLLLKKRRKVVYNQIAHTKKQGSKRYEKSKRETNKRKRHRL